MLVGAHCAMGMSMMYTGNLQAARAHCEHAATFYSRDMRPAYHAMYRMDPGVFLPSELARTLWILGYPDAALESKNAALQLGAESPDPRSKALSHVFASIVHQLRFEVELVLEHSTKVIEICDEHGIAQERVWAMAIHGWALAHSGKGEEGIRELQASIAIQRSKHAELNITYALRQLADALNANGKFIEGRDAAREGLKISERHGEVASKIELYRLMGESARSLAKTGEIEAATHTRSGSTLSPDSCFRAAVELARKQGAKSFELRASLDLAGLLVDRGMEKEARELVAGIRSQITEGAGTRDIKAADEFLARVVV
jgi:tetratricopeptide (TPR) repeat protein